MARVDGVMRLLPLLVGLLMTTVASTAVAEAPRWEGVRYSVLGSILEEGPSSCDSANVACFALDGSEAYAFIQVVDDVDPRRVAFLVTMEGHEFPRMMMCSGSTLNVSGWTGALMIEVVATTGLVAAEHCQPQSLVYAAPTQGRVLVAFM